MSTKWIVYATGFKSTEPGHTLWDTWYRMTATERGRRKTVVLHVSRRQGKRGGRFSSWASWTGSWNTVCMSRQWQSIESINTSVVVPLSLSFLFSFFFYFVIVISLFFWQGAALFKCDLSAAGLCNNDIPPLEGDIVCASFGYPLCCVKKKKRLDSNRCAVCQHWHVWSQICNDRSDITCSELSASVGFLWAQSLCHSLLNLEEYFSPSPSPCSSFSFCHYFFVPIDLSVTLHIIHRELKCTCATMS